MSGQEVNEAQRVLLVCEVEVNAIAKRLHHSHQEKQKQGKKAQMIDIEEIEFM